VINPQTGKPLDEKSLRKHFEREIETGATELFARMDNFIVANIFRMAPPAGTVAIDNQHVRGSLAIFFAKTRMGWKETVVKERANKDGKPFLVDDARQRLVDRLDQIASQKEQKGE
jgi:fructosamine-3-kinase